MGSGRRGLWRGLLPAPLLFCAVLTVFFLAVGKAGETGTVEEKRIAEQSVRRAAVSCYAAEGFYPDSYDYLREHYHVRIDETKYAVQYEAFASNLMPEITIVEVGR